MSATIVNEMLEQIDTNSLAEILSTIDQTYTDQLGWDASTDEVNIEGAVIDEVHHQLFNGDPRQWSLPLHTFTTQWKSLGRH